MLIGNSYKNIQENLNRKKKKKGINKKAFS